MSETEVRVPIADLAAPRVLRWADPGAVPALVSVYMVWRRKPGRAELFLEPLDGSPRFVRTVRDGGEVVAVDRDVDRCAYCGLYSLVPWHSSCRSCERPNDRAEEAPLPADPIATRFIEAYHDAAMSLCDVADDMLRTCKPVDEVVRVELDSYIVKTFALASQAEAAAAELCTEEPSRAVLYRSAATMALSAGERERAEALARKGLEGVAHEEIADELRDVLAKALANNTKKG